MTDYEAVAPRIGPVEPITMRADYQLPFDNKSSQTACGQTIRYQNGDMNWRVVLEGIISKPQLDELRALRGQGIVEVVTEEFGRMLVDFDQFNVTRASEEAVGEINEQLGPLLEFQIQTKENTEDGDSTVTLLEGESRPP